MGVSLSHNNNRRLSCVPLLALSRRARHFQVTNGMHARYQRDVAFLIGKWRAPSFQEKKKRKQARCCGTKRCRFYSIFSYRVLRGVSLCFPVKGVLRGTAAQHPRNMLGGLQTRIEFLCLLSDRTTIYPRGT